MTDTVPVRPTLTGGAVAEGIIFIVRGAISDFIFTSTSLHVVLQVAGTSLTASRLVEDNGDPSTSSASFNPWYKSTATTPQPGTVSMKDSLACVYGRMHKPFQSLPFVPPLAVLRIVGPERPRMLILFRSGDGGIVPLSLAPRDFSYGRQHSILSTSGDNTGAKAWSTS